MKAVRLTRAFPAKKRRSLEAFVLSILHNGGNLSTYVIWSSLVTNTFVPVFHTQIITTAGHFLQGELQRQTEQIRHLSKNLQRVFLRMY